MEQSSAPNIPSLSTSNAVPSNLPVSTDKADNSSEESEHDQEIESLSDSSADSDASDFLHVSALPPEQRSWCTEQDAELSRVQRLAHLLRPRPRLPLDPSDLSKEFEDLDSGVALPLAHCAFRGCTWMHLEELPEMNGETVSHVHLLNEHLKHAQVREFASACGLSVPPEEFLDYYEERKRNA